MDPLGLNLRLSVPSQHVPLVSSPLNEVSPMGGTQPTHGYLPVRSRCVHPGQQQGRRWPSSSSSSVRRMRRSRVISCLASSTQQMNSLRARGVMSIQASSADAVGYQRLAQVPWKLVHRPTGHFRAAHQGHGSGSAEPQHPQSPDPSLSVDPAIGGTPGVDPRERTLGEPAVRHPRRRSRKVKARPLRTEQEIGVPAAYSPPCAEYRAPGACIKALVGAQNHRSETRPYG